MAKHKSLKSDATSKEEAIDQVLGTLLQYDVIPVDDEELGAFAKKGLAPAQIAQIRIDVTAILENYGLGKCSPLLVVNWFQDAEDFARYAEILQNGLVTERAEDLRDRKAILSIKERLEASERLRRKLGSYDVSVENLLAAFGNIIENIDRSPEELKAHYFVRQGRGRKPTNQTRELNALLLNLIGMWHTYKHEIPAVQINPTDCDDYGNLTPQPFIQMTYDLLRYFMREDLIRSVPVAAIEARRSYAS